MSPDRSPMKGIINGCIFASAFWTLVAAAWALS
jgi:hypothetical protein